MVFERPDRVVRDSRVSLGEASTAKVEPLHGRGRVSERGGDEEGAKHLLIVMIDWHGTHTGVLMRI